MSSLEDKLNELKKSDTKVDKKNVNKIIILLSIFLFVVILISAIFNFSDDSPNIYGYSACECKKVILEISKTNQMIIETDIGYVSVKKLSSWCSLRYSTKEMMKC